MKKEDYSIDYRNDTLGAVRDIRKRLKMARAGHVISFVCNDAQIIRLLREITYSEGVIIHQETTADGVYITIRKT